MKQQLNEIRRMQQLAGIIKENTQFDEDKLKKYHEYLLNLGGGDLGGDYKDILSKAKQFDSVEEFIEDDINTLATDDKVQADKIRKWVKQNIKINDGSSLNPRTKVIVDKLLAKTEEAIRIKDTDTLQKIYNKALTVGGGSWDYFIDQLTDKGLASITPRGMLVWNFENPEEVNEPIVWNWDKARSTSEDDEGVVYKVWGQGESYNYYGKFELFNDDNGDYRDIKDENDRKEGNFIYASKYTKDTDELVGELDPEDISL